MANKEIKIDHCRDNGIEDVSIDNCTDDCVDVNFTIRRDYDDYDETKDVYISIPIEKIKELLDE